MLGLRTAWDLLQDEIVSVNQVVSFSQGLDDLLGGGFPLGKLTEVAGAAGVGKTQLCFQLAVDVQIPLAFGGVEGETIYIDTEGSFNTKRLKQIATAAVEHIRSVAETKEQKTVAANWSVEDIFNRIHHCRCVDHIQLVAATALLEDFIQGKPKVKLVIIDSIAYHFRQEFDSFQQRSQLLNSIVLDLMKIAFMNKTAIVLTNQMTTRMDNPDCFDDSSLAPALGDAWGHNCSTRLVLFIRPDGQRRAKLIKSYCRPEGEISYFVTPDGIR